jgi:hypothetical protein
VSNLEPPDGPDDLEIERLRQELAAVERVAELRSELEAARAELVELGGSLEAEAPEEAVPEPDGVRAEEEVLEEEVLEEEVPEEEEEPPGVPPQTVPSTKGLVRALGHSDLSYRGTIAMPWGVHDGLKPSASGLYTPCASRVAPFCSQGKAL